MCIADKKEPRKSWDTLFLQVESNLEEVSLWAVAYTKWVTKLTKPRMYRNKVMTNMDAIYQGHPTRI